MNDLISIVIPVHNAEKYIEVCLKSVILQTYSNLEIIVINDGSTDNSENIIKQQMRKDKRIRLINQKNFGVSLARNIGLKNVNGKYVTFIDADDYVNGDYIQVLYDNLKKMSSEVSICKFTLNEKSYKDTLIEKKYDSKTAIINMLLSLEYDSSVCCKLINSELAKELSFSPDLVIAEDMLYYYNLFKKCNNISFIDKTCYHYIQNSNGAISTISKKKVQNLQIFQKLINECSDLNIKEALINKYISTSFHLLSLDTSKLEKKYLSEIKNNIRIYRKKILFKKNIRLKVKVACALSFFGFNIVDFIMKIERNFKL